MGKGGVKGLGMGGWVGGGMGGGWGGSMGLALSWSKIKKLKLDWIRGQCNKGVYVITNA